MAPTNQQETTAPARGESIFPIGHLLPFAIVTGIFFLWGMSNNLTGILVQQFRKSFELNVIQAQLVETATFLAYGLMAIPAGLLIRRLGYKRGLVIGLCVFATGTLLFWPAAIIGQYAPFLLALFVAGCGCSILETGCNPFIANFGPTSTSERRLNFSQAFNPPGSIIGTLIGTTFIFSGVEKNATEVAQMKAAGTYVPYLHSEIMRVVPTYVGLGVLLLLLALVLSRTSFPNLRVADDAAPTGTGGLLQILRKYPQLWMAVLAQFSYVGAQVGTWSLLIFYMKAYTVSTEKQAGLFLTATLVALAIGRVVSTPLMRFIDPSKMLAIYSGINIALLAVGIAKPGMTGAWAIVATSFFMSIMFPTIFALGLKGLGEDAKLGGSLIVMAIIGGAIFPPLMGVISRSTGKLSLSYALPLLGYVVVALYGLVAPRVSARNVMMSPAVP